MTISSLVIPVLGWLGAGASIAAYYLVSSKRFAPDSLRYHSLNVSSCILLALACASTGAWPSFLTNAIFIGVGCTMIWRVRDRLARRIMQVFASATCAASCRAVRAWRALAESSLKWGVRGQAVGLPLTVSTDGLIKRSNPLWSRLFQAVPRKSP